MYHIAQIAMLLSLVAGGDDLSPCTPVDEPVIYEDSGMLGYQNSDGSPAISARFVIAGNFNSCGYAYADGFYIDTEGNRTLRPLNFDNGPDYFSEGLARYHGGDKIGYMDYNLNIVIPATFDFAFPFKNSMAIVCLECSPQASPDDGHPEISGGKWGVIGKHGEILLPINNNREDARDFSLSE